MRIRRIPSTILIVRPSILVRRQMAMAETMMNVSSMGRRHFRVMYLRKLATIAMEVVSARRPDKAVVSPYEGMRKGRAVIIKCQTRSRSCAVRNWLLQQVGICKGSLQERLEIISSSEQRHSPHDGCEGTCQQDVLL